MLISLSWLREFVELGDRTPETIAHDLTMKTALIEGIEKRGEFHPNLVVGKVRSKDRHPKADRLSVCQVDVGTQVLEIVCGASNVAAGLTVAVATPGTTLKNGLTIQPTPLRGITSHGMICSERELAISENHDGILVLEDELTAGTRLSAVSNLGDTMFEIDNKSITHRPDLWGHEGFARELAAIYRLPWKRLAEFDRVSPGETPWRVSIEAPEGCGRYALLEVKGEVGRPSPKWLQRRLEHAGLRPLSLLVDISNLMLLEIGQPTHPFDADKIAGDHIVVRRSRPGEQLETLDGVKRTLPSGTLLIADDSNPLAIAGIMGGEPSSIGPHTRRAVIECAWFDPVVIRRAATGLQLRTDASARFEKNLDPALVERGIRRFAEWIRTIAPDLEIAAHYRLVGEKPIPSATVRLRPTRCRSKLGIELSTVEMRETLERLEFGVATSGDELQIRVPSFRATRDVLAEDDVIEEIGRLHGYEKIVPTLPRTETRSVELEPVNAAGRRAGQLLRDREGYSEVLSYPYAEDAQLERVGGAGALPYVEIANPLQQTARRLRRSLVPALLGFVDKNMHQAEEIRLYETGKVFLPKPGDTHLPYEPAHLAAVLALRSVKKDHSGALIRRIKGTLEELALRLERALAFEPAGTDRPAYAHASRCARVLGANGPIGYLTEVDPTIAAGLTKKGEIALFEIDLTAWIENPRYRKPYAPLPKFPGIAIDVSFVAPFDLAYDGILARLTGRSKLLRSIDLVDEYFGAPVPAGQRSLTLRLNYRDDERTLTAAEIAVESEQAKSALRELGVELRG